MTTLTQVQQSRLYAQAFGRSVYADILRWGNSEHLSYICHTNKQDKEETYMDCLHRFYHSMKRYYRCEYVFKNEIIAELQKHYTHRKSLVVNEFRVGNSIADLAFFNGESRAYEIKTGFDSPRRLEGQLNDYRRVFDKCYLVVEQSEIGSWSGYDESLGLIAFCHGPRGRITMEEIRPAKINEKIDVDVLMTCLRAEEYEAIAEQYAGAQLSESKYKHFEECKTILKCMDGTQLHNAFLETIERRNNCFKLLNKTPYELYQICLSMHLTDKQLECITNCLNNKIY